MNDYELANTTTMHALLNAIVLEKQLGPEAQETAYWKNIYFHFKLLDVQTSPKRKLGWHKLPTRRTTLDILRGAFDDCDQA